MHAKGATAADFNRAVYERLKPGGCYVIVDHAAEAGAGVNYKRVLLVSTFVSVSGNKSDPMICRYCPGALPVHFLKAR